MDKEENTLLKELIHKQIKDVPSDKKLYLSDIQRILKNINTSIFDGNICSLWTGYVTNLNKTNKGTYINFYFHKRKVALHRLLYCNYVGNIDTHEYLRYTCPNKGICCNINHLKKYTYQTQKDIVLNKEKHTETNNRMKIISQVDKNNSPNNNDDKSNVIKKKEKLYIVFN